MIKYNVFAILGRPMQRKNIIALLDEYEKNPFFTSEEKPFLERFRNFIEHNPRCFERSNRGHITGSAWILNHEGTKALLTHHKKLNSWFQLGGHADGDSDIKRVALKEAQEESGIEHLQFLMPGILDIDIHPIPGPCEFHYDVRFLLQAPANKTFTVSDESHDLAWVDLDKISEYSSERSVLRLAEKVKKKF